MHKIYSAAQAQQIDEYTIKEIGIPSLVLMERAALGVTDRVLDILDSEDESLSGNYYTPKNRPVICVCGKGNNGADALAVARQLSEAKLDVSVYLCNNDSESEKGDFYTQLDICRSIGIKFLKNLTIPENAIVVEGIFGNGLTRAVGGVYRDVIKKINKSGAYVVSIDIPAGINATTGKLMGVAVRADETVTFGSQRIGHILYPGAEYAGRVSVVNIGWRTDSAISNDIETESYLLDDEDLHLFPVRPAFSHKGSFGRLLIVAGSWDYGGAAVLCAKAAYMTGAGLVRVYTHEDNRSAVLSNVPEAIVSEYDKDDFKPEKIKESLKVLKVFVREADSVVVGPGLGKRESSVHILKCVIKNARCPLVMDADALNLIAEDEAGHINKRLSEITITPHVKEAARLLGESTDEVISDMPGACLHLHKELGVNVVLKSAVTLMTDGNRVFFNKGGNSGMAVAGSGDVLAGILGGLAAQGLKGSELLRLGVHLHSEAGAAARIKYGERGMLPSDIAECVRDVVKFL